jgi:hypothetical protein
MTSLEPVAADDFSDDLIVAVLVEMCTTNNGCYMMMYLVSLISLVSMICGCISSPSMSDMSSAIRVTFIREMLFRD